MFGADLFCDAFERITHLFLICCSFPRPKHPAPVLPAGAAPLLFGICPNLSTANDAEECEGDALVDFMI